MPKVVRKFYRDGVEYKIKFDTGWQPGANTIAYYKLDGNLNDSSGNGRNATGSSNITYQTLSSGISVVKLTSNTAGVSVPGNIANLIQGDFTISMRMYITGGPSSANIFWLGKDSGTFDGPNIRRGYEGNGKCGFRLRGGTSPTVMFSSTGVSSLQNKRIHICRTRTSGVNKGYINAIEECSMNSSISVSNGDTGLIVSRAGAGQSLYSGSMGSNIIIEDRGWSSYEVSSYRNQTKSNYGL